MADTVEKATAQRIAMKAVIVNDDKVLLLREASTYDEGTNIGRYGSPGGRLDVGEPFEEGLRREVKEETGLEITIGEPLFVGEWFPVIKGIKTQIIAMYFICQPVGGQEIVLSEEHDDYKWVGAEEAAQLNLMPPEDRVTQTYFARKK